MFDKILWIGFDASDLVLMYVVILLILKNSCFNIVMVVL